MPLARIGERLLRRLREEAPKDGPVVPLYLDLDRTVAQSWELLPIKHHKRGVKDDIAALTRF